MPTSIPTIAIIGAAGTMGYRLLRKLVEAKYTVHVYDAKQESLVEFQATTPTVVIHPSALAAALAADVVILAVPYEVEQELASSFGDSLGNRIIVSVTNPLTPSLDDVVTPHDESAAEHLASLMPHARVVKALNSISASALDAPQQDTPSFDTFVASDDRAAAHAVETIIDSIGFRPWYVGGLILSRTLERMSALLIGVAMRYGLQGALGWRVEQVQPVDLSDVKPSP